MNKQKIELKLYIIERSGAYAETVHKLQSLLGDRLDSCFTLEIIDILKNPERTVEDEILASPTLIRVSPPPSKRVVGSILLKNLMEQLELPDCSQT